MTTVANQTIETNDPWSMKVRLLTALMAALLTFLTIATHRAQSQAMKYQKDASALWLQYQSKRIRDYQLELNSEVMQVIAPTTKSKLAIDKFTKQRDVYNKELNTIATDARTKEGQADKIYNKALWLENSVGVIEVALVLCSLYFIANRRIFPMFGMMMALIGMAMALLSLLSV